MTIQNLITIDYWAILPLFIIGSVLHFVYDWSKHKKEAAIFSAVNESYWEHIKIAFWPTFFLYLGEFILGGWQYASFVPAKTIALFSIIITMISIVFLYKSFSKKNILLIDISCFFITLAFAQIIGAHLLDVIKATNVTILLSLPFLVVIVISFAKYTITPPKETDFFIDPITKKYGLKGHNTP